MGEQSWYSGLGDWFGNAASGAKSWLGDGKNLSGLGQLVGGLGGAYAANEQSKAAKAMLDLQKQSFFDEKDRRKKTQLTLDEAFNTATPLVPAPKLTLGA